MPTCGTSKNALQNSSSTHFRLAEGRAVVDDQPLDLVEHRRVRLVGVAAIGAAGADDADRRLLRQHRAHLDRAGVGAQELALAIRVGRKKNVSCISRAGWPGGKLSLVKL